MGDLLISAYPWIKTVHIVAVVSWMAGLLYLPRLFVYHADAASGSEVSELFKVMERKLLGGIMTPAMVVVWVLGLSLAVTPGIVGWGIEWWFFAKLACVLALTGFHLQCIRWCREFAEDRNPRSARYYRIANEVPTVILIAIVVLVVVRPI